MVIYNTLSKTKERLIPREDNKIKMFVCGPTVYDYIHIGNARTFVFFDIVAKYLRHQGYDVDYIQNITDIDDKIIQKAKEAGREPMDWAKEYYEKFKDDMEALGVDAPRYIPATEHIEQVIKQVKALIAKGHAYLIEGDGYYFDLSTFKEYGKLSGRRAEMADDAITRIDENNKKKNKGDFCLWKFSKENEPAWDFETSEPLPRAALGSFTGRPGWHIEDTAITEHYFGPQYDLHGGGQDLIFPHHEAEITQQESISGKKPFVKYWMHVAFLINKEQKMSKSLGNFETVTELLKKYPKEVLRFYLLSSYYRSPLDYSETTFRQARAAIDRIAEFVQKLKNVPISQIEAFEEARGYLDEAKNKFLESMDNDFNTPEALAAIFELIRKTNPLLATSQVDKSETIDFLGKVDQILGIIPTEEQKIPIDIQGLIEKREQLRKNKDYPESDRIRIQIEALGWEVEDTIYGPLAMKK